MDPHLLRPDQLAEFREIFAIFADEKTRRIPVKSLLRIRSDLGFADTEETLSTRISCLVSPAASTAGLEFADFVTFVASPAANDGGAGGDVDFEAEMEGVFRQLDLNGDGVLDASEILAAAAVTTTTTTKIKDGADGFPRIIVEDAMEMEDAELVLDDADKREEMTKEEADDREMYVDSWEDFERAEKTRLQKMAADGATRGADGAARGAGDAGVALGAGRAGRRDFCLRCRQFKELIQD